MRTAAYLAELRTMRASMKGTFGLVPTMGALHAGHCSLVERARVECENVGVSIFINPMQFSPNEDFNNYPKSYENDLQILTEIGVDYLFYPEANEIYTEDFDFKVVPGKLSNYLCGKFRDGHFTGVATICLKLFNIVKPTTAYFGLKDYQQNLIKHLLWYTVLHLYLLLYCVCWY